MPVNTVSNVVHENPHVHPDTRARVQHLIKIGCHRIAAIGSGPTRNRRPHTVAPRHEREHRKPHAGRTNLRECRNSFMR
ncbi:LacI family DNA-binding transcriptional regulator [Cutibacterium acnes]|uniref:LacI family DNA-binding transcriptional regulator n=1 Tax=Cutibacterium acnes TaxID=1747 RepID=UPI001F419755|nr:LacI family DNA-binding transcriptional regulator [Cutibacterium acnes]MDF2199449.1 LacI family DNA-binding transcriptional regulator [Cutibacterium acnes subsp. defendens]MDF2229423.1 LacI family DNA-binding transcriptional regulator [Cutibacterium acnes subsp. defendens]MDF2252024.1 LacI family DNA-binding transcriptional regulator [Cutibacterium acnes subsp. defendens]WHE31332.1 LacI family DNA-binding transcriptional regulator [Cutibacterium acnes subsp. acnes]